MEVQSCEVIKSGRPLGWVPFISLLPWLLFYSYLLEGFLDRAIFQHADGSGRPSAEGLIDIFGAPLAGLLGLAGYLALRSSARAHSLAVLLLLAVPLVSAVVAQLALLVYFAIGFSIPAPG